ncbi:efflux transporter outer membrane subunit [Bordetella petrii]|uniref:Probable outer membrane efflux protein n=1 Tax=Bordetella petrii (strain ATCC BAA-461 / DSM 12804 / CCUG 43448 / CIP 107267 / Se-1111R) TaxID=340100 RepID=A9IAE3_BORPD|nr:efflux transporter outer membrane subunit [Bordetella petrii]CAP44577.1 probable outer membrane efflux protein [Bordetella petrii]
MKAQYLLLGVLALGMLSACSLAPEHQRPVAPIPAVWPTGAQTTANTSDFAELGWRSFVVNDEARGLVQAALENNRDLRKAVLSIEAARAQYRITRAARLPDVGIYAEGERQRGPADLNPDGQSGVQSSYQVGVGLNAYEIDLFGRVRSLSEAALREYLATEEAARTVQISLIGEVLEAYIAADGALRRLQLTQETLTTRLASLELIRSRHDSGVASTLDYQDALALTEAARADLERTEREYQQARNALALLVGNGADRNSLVRTVATGQIVSSVVEAGLTSDLLTRRPDIRAAEYRLMARNADIGAARAAFFPSITLTGAFGTASSELSGLFDSGSRAWSFLPQINLPIFRGGVNVANLDLAKVRRDAAISDYEKAIQQAFREVSDALDARRTLDREWQARTRLAEASTTGLRLAEARYIQGLDGYMRFLDSQRSNFFDRISLSDVSTQYQISLVRLFRAVGGSWDSQQLGDTPESMGSTVVTGSKAEVN